MDWLMLMMHAIVWDVHFSLAMRYLIHLERMRDQTRDCNSGSTPS